MKEKVKTIILLLLVINSLILTTLLIFYKPSNVNVSLSEYLPRLTFGEEKDSQELIKPEKLVFHYGEDIHRIVYPNQEIYNTIFQEMEHWSYYDITPVFGKIDWTEIIENNQGLEVIYQSNLPDSLLGHMFNMTSLNGEIDGINRIWITRNQDDSILAYFISDEKGKIYATQTSISIQKLEKYLASAENEVTYTDYWKYPTNDKLIKSAYYLPNEGLDMFIYEKKDASASIEDFIQLLFIDPTVVKKIEMDDKQNILYTDGNRSMTFYPNNEYISYFQPIADNKKELNYEKDLYSAIRYVNQHGGWDGNYYLDKINTFQTGSQTQFRFRLYIDGYPLVDNIGKYGTIQLKMTDGFVSNFERSIISLENYKEPVLIKTHSNEQLIQYLSDKNIGIESINAIEINYTLRKENDSIFLEPYWKIDINGQSPLLIPAYESVVQ